MKCKVTDVSEDSQRLDVKRSTVCNTADFLDIIITSKNDTVIADLLNDPFRQSSNLRLKAGGLG